MRFVGNMDVESDRLCHRHPAGTAEVYQVYVTARQSFVNRSAENQHYSKNKRTGSIGTSPTLEISFFDKKKGYRLCHTVGSARLASIEPTWIEPTWTSASYRSAVITICVVWVHASACYMLPLELDQLLQRGSRCYRPLAIYVVPTSNVPDRKHARCVCALRKSRGQRVHYGFCDWHQISATHSVQCFGQLYS